MRSAECGARSWIGGLCGLAVFIFTSVGAGEEKSEYTTETLRGQVVFLAEEMEKQTGVKTVSEAKERILALRTAAGDLVPLLEDVRGRAFRRDKRLRDMQVELMVRRYHHSPLRQILRVCEVAKDGLYEIDYWCNTCAIALYEDIDCECCQGPLELRKRKID
jgi:hypothetical protein